MYPCASLRCPAMGSSTDYIKRMETWTKASPFVRFVSMTNLTTHLVRRHQETHASQSVDANASKSKDKQDKVTNIKNFPPQLSHNWARAQVITASIAIAVDCDCFRDIVNTLELRYNIPSRQQFTAKVKN